MLSFSYKNILYSIIIEQLGSPTSFSIYKINMTNGKKFLKYAGNLDQCKKYLVKLSKRCLNKTGG